MKKELIIILTVLTFVSGLYANTTGGEQVDAVSYGDTKRSPAADPVLTFPDALLEEAIRKKIKKDGGDLRLSDVEGLTTLGAAATWSAGGVSNLSGVSNLINLKLFSIWHGYVSDVSELSSMINLEILTLPHNRISDVSALSTLFNLTKLYLENNNISDISGLSTLVNMQYLNLSGNNITDISSLLSMENLKILTIAKNPLSQESVNIYIPQLEARGTLVIYY